MKKRFIILSLFTLFFSVQFIQAKGVIIYHNGPKVEVKEELPEDAFINDEHVNLGVMYNQFGLFWLPLWNYGTPQYVLINDKEDTYYDLDEEDIALLQEEYGVNLAKAPKPSLWQQIGLKPVIVLLVFFLIWGNIGGKKDEEEREVEAEEKAAS